MSGEIEFTVGNLFKLTRKIGSGAFGEIFQGINIKNNFEVAIKLEPVSTKHPQLLYEVELYQYLLQDETVIDKGIPQVYYWQTEGEYNIMVMDLLGPSLEDLFNFCNRKFSLKSVLLLAEQMMQRIEYVHHRHFLHRDIAPDNFLIGSTKQANKIFIIDFGLAKRYQKLDGTHIPQGDSKNLARRARYASTNTHLGIEQGRRDDLESLGYVLMYFLRGSLPWQNLKTDNQKDKYKRIMEKKLSTPTQVLCQNFPDEFVKYFTHCKNLRFDEKPDYNYCQQLFKERFQKEGYEKDFNFDWNKIAKERKAEQGTNANQPQQTEDQIKVQRYFNLQ